MGIFDFLRPGSEPTPSQIRKAIKQVTQPHGDPAVRLAAFDRLKEWGTPESVAALLRRFTIQTPSGQRDLEECQEVERMLVELGPIAVEPIVEFLEKEASVAYPARALEKILPREAFVERILGVLDRLDSSFGSQEEQRAGLIRAFEDIDDPGTAAARIRRFVDDPSDDVAIAAIGCIARTGDEAYRDELIRLLVESVDRPRVRREAAERLAQLGWPMREKRKQVESCLPDGFALDKKGRLVSTSL